MLCKRYWEYSRQIGTYNSYRFSSFHVEKDELISVAFSSLAIAINKYDGSIKNFKAYWKRIVEHETQGYIDDNVVNRIGNDRIISYDTIEDSDNGPLIYSNIIGEDDKLNSRKDLLMFLSDYLYCKDNDLSPNEILVAYYMFFHDYEISDIMEYTHWDKGKVYNIVRSVKDKISLYIKNNYFN